MSLGVSFALLNPAALSLCAGSALAGAAALFWGNLLGRSSSGDVGIFNPVALNFWKY
ncbi:hypothetical protein [Thermoleptolyngbya sp.]